MNCRIQHSRLSLDQYLPSSSDRRHIPASLCPSPYTRIPSPERSDLSLYTLNPCCQLQDQAAPFRYPHKTRHACHTCQNPEHWGLLKPSGYPPPPSPHHHSHQHPRPPTFERIQEHTLSIEHLTHQPHRRGPPCRASPRKIILRTHIRGTRTSAEQPGAVRRACLRPQKRSLRSRQSSRSCQVCRSGPRAHRIFWHTIHPSRLRPRGGRRSNRVRSGKVGSGMSLPMKKLCSVQHLVSYISMALGAG
jgi:hypothetical protein